MGREYTQCSSGWIKLKRNVIGVQPIGPKRDQGAEWVLLDDDMHLMGPHHREMVWNVHLINLEVG
jgi:hypothetical protein